MNNSPSNKLIKNTGYYTIALVIQKVISFTYFSYLASKIGSIGTAKYFFAVSFVTIFSVFIDLGLSSLINREIAKNKESHQKLLSNVLGVKILSTLLIIIAIFIFSNILNYNQYLKNMIYLSMITMIIDSFTITFFAVIRGKHNLKYESISSILFQLIVITTGYFMLQKTQEPLLLLIVLLVASIFNFIYSSIILIKKYKINISPKFDKEFIKLLLVTTCPFAIAGIFMRISGSIDSVFLSKLATEKALGYYGLAYKITFAFQFIPLAFSASLYPAFTHFFHYEKEKLENIFNKSIIYLLIISFPISVGIISLTNPIILKIYGYDFYGAILTLQILISSIPFLFVTFPMGALLNATNLQKKHTINIGITMLVSIIFNFTLIKLYSQNGAAMASIISTLTYLILNTITCKKIINIHYKEIIINIIKILIACTIMVLSIKYLENKINLLFVITIGATIYTLTAYILKIFTKKDLSYIKSLRKT
ncbi:MAG: flippase [Patescibacteria group bacterium]|nr:flippase [Patescibacteria group bacterium]MDD4304326.1 flippase [Patescibacteria group bacterium]MDD4695589.1 flippase [Patescibacteria group bacterium]